MLTYFCQHLVLERNAVHAKEYLSHNCEIYQTFVGRTLFLEQLRDPQRVEEAGQIRKFPAICTVQYIYGCRQLGSKAGKWIDTVGAVD